MPGAQSWYTVITMLLLFVQFSIVVLADAFQLLLSEDPTGSQDGDSPPEDQPSTSGIQHRLSDQVVPDPVPQERPTEAEDQPLDLTTTVRDVDREEQPQTSSSQTGPCSICAEERRRGGLREFTLGRFVQVSSAYVHVEFCRTLKQGGSESRV